MAAHRLRKQIVLTGGPCSGKTTALNYLAEKLRDKGFRVFTVEEFATMLILAGVGNMNELAKKDPEKYLKIEEQMLLSHLESKKRFEEIARVFDNEDCIIIFDRGALDTKAYMPDDFFEVLMDTHGLTIKDVRDNYDGVIHLVTTAFGAEDFYTIENNKARRENLEEARMADLKTQLAWLGHPHLRLIDNSTDFRGKLRRLLQAACRIIEMPVPLEIERKFLLKKPPDFDSPILKDAQKIIIEQMYLQPEGEKEERRIRKRLQENWGASYYQTFKRTIAVGKRAEREEAITALDYFRLRKLQLPGTSIIRKNRFCFIFENQYFELDQILEPKKCWLLEIELTEENDKLVLPPFLAVKKEVTGGSRYSNYEIAKKGKGK